MNKFFYYISYITILSALFLIGLVLFWMVYPYRILEFQDAKFPVLSKKVVQGGSLNYYAAYCKYANIPSLLTRSFTNGILYTMPSMTTNNPTGCHKVMAIVAIPKELPVGTYQMKLLYEYDPNPIRHITIEMYTEKFEVIE